MTKRARPGFVAFIPAIGVEAIFRFESEGNGLVQITTAPVIAWGVTRSGRADAIVLWKDGTGLASKCGATSVEFRTVRL